MGSSEVSSPETRPLNCVNIIPESLLPGALEWHNSWLQQLSRNDDKQWRAPIERTKYLFQIHKSCEDLQPIQPRVVFVSFDSHQENEANRKVSGKIISLSFSCATLKSLFDSIFGMFLLWLHYNEVNFSTIKLERRFGQSWVIYDPFAAGDVWRGLNHFHSDEFKSISICENGIVKWHFIVSGRIFFIVQSDDKNLLMQKSLLSAIQIGLVMSP